MRGARPRRGRVAGGAADAPGRATDASTGNGVMLLWRRAGSRVADPSPMQILQALASILVVCSLSSVAIGDDRSSVVGGQPVPDGAWPDAVAVLGNAGSCSGTLIAPDVVLTAGHCIDIDPVVVVIDAVDLDAGGEWIGIERAEAYPAWETSYDVGVLVLAHASRTRPRKIARTCTATEQLHAGAEVTVVGFGRTTPDGRGGASVKHAATIVVSDPLCTSDPGCLAGEFIAGGDGVDACFGDSGGPAYVDTAAGPILLGVVSRGLSGDWKCGNGGIYVRVDRVARWIERITGRRLPRSVCHGSGDDPGDGAETDGEGGGCAAGGSAAGPALGLLAALGLVGRSRRRRCRPGSSWA
jgi:hypothetical protein